MSEEVPTSDSPERTWQHQFYVPSEEERARWATLGMPPDNEIIDDVVGSKNRIWGVPDKQTLFELSDQTAGDDLIGYDMYGRQPHRTFVTSIASPLESELRIPPITTSPNLGITEHNYHVLLMVTTIPMDLFRIVMVSGDRDTPSKAAVFEATEFPGARYQRRLRIIRVTVHEDSHATYEVLAETRYPPH